MKNKIIFFLFFLFIFLFIFSLNLSGENKTFKGPEDYVRSCGVDVEVVNDPDCIALMEKFIKTINIKNLIIFIF